ncbi:MAG: HD domain-containing protein [Chloroflexota bacterium]|nr:HD domain-containing protein [Chloroflexota bacterium]
MTTYQPPHRDDSGLLDGLSDAQRRAIARLAAEFARRGAALFLVGGSVRDLLLGRRAPDLDFATDAGPGAIREAAARAGASAIHMANERFATVGLQLEGEALEITQFRGDVDGAAALTGLREDLARRDFTINAMALSLDLRAPARLIDPFDGRGDLERHTVRGVGDPDARLAEDPLRALRAVRFAAEFDYTIEPETRAAVIRQAALRGVSPERIGAELGRLLLTPHVAMGLQSLERLGLFPASLPEVVPLVEFTAERSKDLWTHTRIVVARTPPRAAVRWAALLHDAAKPQTYSVQGDEVHFFGHEVAGARLARQALGRLRLGRELVAGVAKLVELHGRPAQYDASWTDGAVRRLLLDIGSWLDDLLDLARADVTSGRAQAQQRARARIDALSAHCARIRAEQELAKLQSPLDGQDLMALFDRPPGPWIKPVKEHLRGLVIDGALAPDDREGAMAAARRWVIEHEMVS